jgi:hypothetical protein
MSQSRARTPGFLPFLLPQRVICLPWMPSLFRTIFPLRNSSLGLIQFLRGKIVRNSDGIQGRQITRWGRRKGRITTALGLSFKSLRIQDLPSLDAVAISYDFPSEKFESRTNSPGTSSYVYTLHTRAERTHDSAGGIISMGMDLVSILVPR